MNKKMIIGISAACIACLLGGIGLTISNANEGANNTETTQQNNTQANNNQVTDNSSNNNQVTDNSTNNNQNTDNTNNLDESKFISSDDAKSVALKHANLKDSSIDYIKCDLDNDTDDDDNDDRAVYEIEFGKDNIEYEYEIDAITSEVISYNQDTDNDKNTTSSTAKFIGSTKAKSIALDHANLKESSVEYIKCNLDNDDSKDIYEIEFREGTTEHEYELDATTGEIISYDVDNDNN